jgi:hypothetical protein
MIFSHNGIIVPNNSKPNIPNNSKPNIPNNSKPNIPNNSKPIAPIKSKLTRSGYNMFDAVTKFSNCNNCNKIN